jgi:pyrroline-5-carboxylate reductase
MNCEHVAFVGGGRITRILLAAWERAGQLPERLAIIDPDAVAAERLTKLYPHARVCTDMVELMQDAPVVFLAIHPPLVVQAAESLSRCLHADALVVSLAPKVTLAQLANHLPSNAHVARFLPNAASLIGKGFNPLVFGGNWEQPARTRLRQVLQYFGECPEVPESQMEAYAILTAMGPTYFWFQWQELRQLAAKMELAATDADHALQVMLQGAIELLFQSGLTYEAVVDLIPVRPLKEEEDLWRSVLTEKLLATRKKIRPS